jgi:hypothetical protein
MLPATGEKKPHPKMGPDSNQIRIEVPHQFTAVQNSLNLETSPLY